MCVCVCVVLFAFLYQLLVTQSWSSQTSIFEGFISFVRVFLCKSYIVDKESGCSGFDSCVKYKSAFPSFFLLFFLIARSSHEFVTKLEQS